MSINFNKAIITGKLGDSAINVIDRSRGTNWAGRKAMEIDPEILNHFSGIDPERVLFITGTNGKSTVNSLINHILRHRGFKVVSNIEGANLVTGVASALVKASSLSGKVKADYYIFETDERYLYQIREQLPCSNLLITNLQKDQVQRNGDPDFVYRKISKVVKDFKMNLFRNGAFSNEDIVVSHQEYRDYAERNTGIRLTDREADLSVRVRISPDCEAVLESDLNGAYLMIDARGYLVDNTMNDNYVAVADAAGDDLAAGLARLNFNAELYQSRYSA